MEPDLIDEYLMNRDGRLWYRPDDGEWGPVERVPALPLVPSPPYLKVNGVWLRSPEGSFWVDNSESDTSMGF